MLSALLIQLFGRDVIDRLARTGFDTTEAIARAGVDRLSDEGGIPPSLARRIIAVAVETPVTEEPEPDPAVATPKRPKTRKAARGGKRGTTSTTPTARQDLDAPASPDETAGWPDHSLDAFVDDASLVSFMGLAAKGGSPNPSRFSVAEEILDPDPLMIPFDDEQDPAVAASPPADPAAASGITPESEIAPDPTARAVLVAAPGPMAAPEPFNDVAVPDDTGAPRPQARPGAAVVTGSFWGFGTPVEGIGTLPFREETSRGPGLRAPRNYERAPFGFEDAPRRRSSDGH